LALTSYTKTAWVNGGTPAINATNLNKVEQRLYDLTEDALTPSYNTEATVTQEITSLASTILEAPFKSCFLQGRTVANILPDAVAGCESNTGWTASSGTIATDSSNEFEGTNCLKATLGGTTDTYDYDILPMLTAGRYYLLCGRIKNGNATNIKLGLETDDQDLSTSVVTATTYNRVGVVIAPTDFDAASSAVLRITVTGTAGQYVFFDTLMLVDITSAEYALGASALLTKYPYHRDIKGSDKCRVLSVGKNLFDKRTVLWGYSRNSSGALAVTTGYACSDYIKVEPNTVYVDGLAEYVQFFDINKNFISRILSTNFTTPANCVYLTVNTTQASLDTYQLEKGSTATTYEPYTETTALSPVTLRSVSDTIYDKFDALTGLHTKNVSDVVTLSGNAYTWAYDADASGYKSVKVLLSLSFVNYKALLFKYNNKSITVRTTDSLTASDQMILKLLGGSDFYLTISDTDTGWEEAWTSGTSFTGLTWGGLIKAYMNGWKLTTADVDVANCVWTGITSGTVKNAGAADYTHVTTTIDTGFTPYRMYYQLATPVETQYYPNSLKSYPSGTIYVEPFVEETGYYGASIIIADSSYPISSLNYVSLVDPITGVETPVSLSDCTVASGGLGFTVSDASIGEKYKYGYTNVGLSSQPSLTYTTSVSTVASINQTAEAVERLDEKVEQLENKTVGLWRKIVDYTFASELASVEVDIPTCSMIRIYHTGISNTGVSTQVLAIQCNGDTGANYNGGASYLDVGTTTTTLNESYGEVLIHNTQDIAKKVAYGFNGTAYHDNVVSWDNTTDLITSLLIYPVADNFDIGGKIIVEVLE
jgi:hypothetical protein